MKVLDRTAPCGAALAASAFVAPTAAADTAPPHLTDGSGLKVVGQPAWVDANMQRLHHP